MAAKCVPTAASPSASTIQRRAVRALVIVSIVVKVFEQMTNSVVSGSSLASRVESSAASRLDT